MPGDKLPFGDVPGEHVVLIEVDGGTFAGSPEEFRELREKLNEVRFIDEKIEHPGPWVPVTAENSQYREDKESWVVDCPNCGAANSSMYGPSEDATRDCFKCGATLQFGIRVIDVDEEDEEGDNVE